MSKVKKELPDELIQKIKSNNGMFTNTYNTPGQVYVAIPDPTLWTKKFEGVMSLATDKSNNAYINLYDFETGKILFSHELYYDFKKSIKVFSHNKGFFAFPSDYCWIGLQFVNDEKMKNFRKQVERATKEKPGFFKRLFSKGNLDDSFVSGEVKEVEYVSGAKQANGGNFDLTGSYSTDDLDKILEQLGYTRDQFQQDQVVQQKVMSAYVKYTNQKLNKKPAPPPKPAKAPKAPAPPKGAPPPPPPPPPPGGKGGAPPPPPPPPPAGGAPPPPPPPPMAAPPPPPPAGKPSKGGGPLVKPTDDALAAMIAKRKKTAKKVPPPEHRPPPPMNAPPSGGMGGGAGMGGGPGMGAPPPMAAPMDPMAELAMRLARRGRKD